MLARRRFLSSTTALAASLAWLDPQCAMSQGVSNIVEMRGDIAVNGRRLAPDGVIQTGDRVQAGPGSSAGFTIGRDAFLIRPNTDLTLSRGSSLFFISGARLITGALLAVFGRSELPRALVAPTVTAGIRGTGFYVEVRPDSTYFCTCFGTIVLDSLTGDSETVIATRHQARRILATPSGGRSIVTAPFEHHDDVELEQLAKLVGQRAP